MKSRVNLSDISDGRLYSEKVPVHQDLSFRAKFIYDDGELSTLQHDLIDLFYRVLPASSDFYGSFHQAVTDANRSSRSCKPEFQGDAFNKVSSKNKWPYAHG